MTRTAVDVTASHSTLVFYFTLDKYIRTLPLILVLGTLNPGLKNLFILKRYKGVQVYSLLRYCTLYLNFFMCSIFVLYEAKTL